MVKSKTGFKGVSDKLVKNKTGKTSKEWYDIIELDGIDKKGQIIIAKYLRDKYGLSSYWANYISNRFQYEKGIKKDMKRRYT